MDKRHKWVTRFAIVMVVMNLSLMYSGWRVLYALKGSTPISCIKVQNEIESQLQP